MLQGNLYLQRRLERNCSLQKRVVRGATSGTLMIFKSTHGRIPFNVLSKGTAILKALKGTELVLLEEQCVCSI